VATTALTLYLVYLATAFGLRSLLQYRRTGSTGFHGVSGRPGSLEWCGGALFVLALLLGLLGPVLQLFDILDPVRSLDATPIAVGGLVLTLVGITATLAAQRDMGVSWRIGVEQTEVTDLVVNGAYAWVRNPVFTAVIATGAGLALMTPNPVALTALVALVIAIEIQVRAVEEPYLLRTHGQRYRDYAARTGRFVPRIGRLGTTTTSPNG
jgi:protein-S-isoprenylcysteine O-methyltransferase Ste14